MTVGELIAYLATLNPDTPILHENYDPENDVSFFTEPIVWTNQLVTKLYNDGEVHWDDGDNPAWNTEGLVTVSEPTDVILLDGSVYGS